MKTRLQLLGKLALPAVCVILFCATASHAATVYYVGNSAQDTALQNHISGLGHTVVAVSGSGSSGFADAQAQGADVIVISGSISSSLANNRGYHTSTIPILHFEPAAYDNFGWTAVGSGDYMDSAGPHDTLAIVDASHPITSGFSVGNHTVLVPTSMKRFGFATPSGDADVLATIYSTGTEKGANKPALFVYERGDSLVRATEDVPSVSTAKSRYIGFFLDNYTGPSDLLAEMTPDGVKLFDQALSHALDPRRAHWTFDNDFTDAVGDNDGTAVGGASVTNLIGESVLGGGALKLSKSSSQYVRVDGLAGELETGDDMTVTMWFNTTRGNAALGGLSMSGMGDNVLFSAHNSSGAVNYFRIGTGVDGGIFLSANSLGGPANDEEFGSSYNNGQWHLLAGTFASDGSTTIYVDGTEVPGFMDTAGHPQWSSAMLFSLGQEWDGAGASNQYDGLIDEVQIWGRLLSVDEISALYLEGIPEPSSLILLSLGLLGLSGCHRRRRQGS